MKIFLTGGTGLLGSHIVKGLQDHHHEVKLLARSLKRARRLIPAGVEIVQGDLRDVTSFSSELEGCDVLIHAGAYFTEFFKKGNLDNALYDINVKGTNLLFQEACEKGVRHIIYVSSTGVLDTSNGEVADENTPYDETTNNPYFKSKIEAEKIAMAFNKNHPKVRVITILPAIMMGPNDHGVTRMGEFVISFLKERLPAVLPVKTVIVDARDVANSIVAAIDKGRNGERYIIGGTVYEVKDIVSVLSDISGRSIPKRKPSFKLIMLMSGLMAMRAKITGKPSPIPKRDELKKLRNQKGYSSMKAKEDLGVTFRPLTTTLSDTVSWFEENDYLN
ncbi:NAD-dependent epimerase/dehydratase family protein [Salipaludibacillus sp. LMS25]|jgi:dihydroflavonol-4-reductase|uniref:NAD-dependent epimerase/dehydratase family protein n=1 Tax=Salipaludibacillus sp. LMS25 TaxID=2924031 RepID=UPI0020D1E1E8|nr:NAD-dependent epimerase/dehydratase family protein [Salipaludibacillus sp. LMS25]UTR14001.1 NAD-dependent epimerase/dehydratase family protein [Salipaludibacillus sp. LMS25]